MILSLLLSQNMRSQTTGLMQSFVRTKRVAKRYLQTQIASGVMTRPILAAYAQIAHV